MENLNLPVLKENVPAARRMSMDDYLRFINLCLKYTLSRKAAKRHKIKDMPGVIFHA